MTKLKGLIRRTLDEPQMSPQGHGRSCALPPASHSRLCWPWHWNWCFSSGDSCRQFRTAPLLSEGLSLSILRISTNYEWGDFD